MKKSILATAFMLVNIATYACSCITPPPFLEYIASEDFIDRGGVIWEGEYIQDMPIPGTTLHATQYLIRDIWCGSFVEAVEYDSSNPGPFPVNTDWIDDFQITENKVWVIGGDGATCLEFHGDNNMIFATTYDHMWGPAFGYSTSLCAVDFFPISSTDVVTGFIESNETTSTMTRDELKAAANIATEEVDCDTANGINDIHFEKLSVFPNPVSEYLQFTLPEVIQQNAILKIYDLSGALIAESVLSTGQSSFGVGNLAAGKYLLVLSDQSGQQFSGQFVK